MIRVIAFIVTGVFVPMLILECLDWLPWVADRLIQRAASHLPLESQARYVEEWKAEFSALPGGKLTKLLFGLRIYTGARTTGKVIREEAKMQAEMAETNLDTAARVLSLAQQTGDQAIADARREAEVTLALAQHEADRILAGAHRQALHIAGAAGNSLPGEDTSVSSVDQPPPGDVGL